MNCCTENEIHDILEMATMGKIELERTAIHCVGKMFDLIDKIVHDEEPEEEP